MLSKVAVPRTPTLWEHSTIPTVEAAGIVGRDFERTTVHVTPSGESEAVNVVPDRLSFIQRFGKE